MKMESYLRFYNILQLFYHLGNWAEFTFKKIPGTVTGGREKNSGAPNKNIVQNHLPVNIALVNVF